MRTRLRSLSSFLMRTAIRRRSVFELRLARTARADSAAQPGERTALAGETRQHIFQLRKLHLQTPFGRARAAGEYVENQLGAVDHLDVDSAFEITLLRRRELAVDNPDAGIESLRQFGQLLDFAVSEQRRGIEDGTNLKHFGHDLGSGAGGELGELAKRFRRSRRRRSASAFKARKDGLLRVLLE